MIREIRQRGERTRKNKSKRRARERIPHWIEKDVVNGKVTDSLAVILSTSGCVWGQKSNCTMCGYYLDSRSGASLMDDLRSVIDDQETARFLKIYNSGSFLDPEEIPRDVQKDLVGLAGDRFDRVLIESRPEFITRSSIEDLRKFAELEVAVGLESADNDVLMHSINKGFTFQNFEVAAGLLRSMDIPLRTYLLLKPPFLTEGDAIKDVVHSIRAVEDLSETISVNPMNIQNFTFVEHLFRKGKYHPPYLWSLLECLTTSSAARLMSAPSGGGSSRGVHNCGICDKGILEGISSFSLDQNPSHLDHHCSCRDEWEDLIALEDTIQASLRRER